MARLKIQNEENEIKLLDTKFGKIKISEEEVIYFPYGIVGIPNINKYYLTQIENIKLQGTYILHSCAPHNISFILIPLVKKFYSDENSLLKKSDVLFASEGYNIAIEDLKLFLIMSNKKFSEENKNIFTVNLKAPILVNPNNRLAYQHVFLRTNYPTSFELK